MPRFPACEKALVAAALCLASPALSAPAVVADITPVHSIVARIMAGVGEPQLLLPPGASPHGYSLRPSEAAMLEAADLVFWTGEGLTPWLHEPLEAIAADSQIVALPDVEGVRLLPVRKGGPFEPHPHEEHAREGEEHGHDEDSAFDGHLWLDPGNAAAIGSAAAEALAVADPENAETYRGNAQIFATEVEALAAEIASRIDALEQRGFVVFHDAFQYFEDRFGIPAAGSIALHDAEQPPPARMVEIRERIAAHGIACVFAEPQFDTRLIATAIEGTDARMGTLDPVGLALEPGPDLYPSLMRQLADDIVDCLEG